MYAKLEEGKLIPFEGNWLQYNVVEDDVLYYVQVFNPTEQEFNEAGYYKVINPESGSAAYYKQEGNYIVGKAADNNEEASVQ